MKLILLLLLSCQLFCVSTLTELSSKLQAYQQRQKLTHNIPGYLATGEVLRKLKTLPAYEQFHHWFMTAFLEGRRDVFFRYPSLSLQTLQELCALVGVKKGPLPTYLDIKYGEFMRWRSALSPYSLEAQFAIELDALFFSEGSHGTFKTIQDPIRAHLDAKDFDQKTLAALSQIGDLMGYEHLKVRLAHLRQWQNRLNINPHSVLYALSECMAQEMEDILLYGGGDDEFETWMLTTFSGSQTIYFQYPGIGYDALKALFADLSLPSPEKPTLMDALKNTTIEKIARSKSPPEQAFYKDLLEQIEQLESFGALDTLQAWYRDIVSSTTLQALYPGISKKSIREIEDLLLLHRSSL